MKKILFFILSFLIFSSSSYANVTVKNEKVEKKTTITLQGNTVIVDGDIDFPVGMRIPYDMHILGNVSIGDYSTIVGNITVDGDIKIGNSVVIYKKIIGNNISTGNKLVAKYIESQGNLTCNGKATITGGVEVGGNFEAGSDLTLYGNSRVEGNMKVELDTFITGTLYVYGDLRSKERFIFSNGKLKIFGDFRTLEESEINGRFYVYGTKGRRSYYTNKIKINYQLENTKFSGFLGKLDPVLSYKLSPSEIHNLNSQIGIKLNNIEQKKKEISFLPYNYSQNLLDKHIQELKNMEKYLIQYIDKYISEHTRDIQEWKIIQFQRENDLKIFLYKYVY